jgi:cystathionine beta-lyase/cystathionine gamma-synthase
MAKMANSNPKVIVFIVNKDTIYEKMVQIAKITGIHICNEQITNMNKSILNMNNRMSNSTDMTTKVLKYLLSLDNNSKISIMHPLVSTHISNLYARKYFNTKFSPSVICIGFNKTKDEIDVAIKKIKILDIGVSFGGEKTKINLITYKNIGFIDDLTYIRLSIGHNDNFERIVLGLNELISLCK